MVQDARQRTKTFLDAYLEQANVTKDNDTTYAIFKTMYAFPPYPLALEFKAPSIISIIYAIDKANSTPRIQSNRTPYGYDEHVPIIICSMDKTGVTGTLVNDKAAIELRRICEENPTGSLRHLEFARNEDQRFGGETLYKNRYVMHYRRDTT